MVAVAKVASEEATSVWKVSGCRVRCLSGLAAFLATAKLARRGRFRRVLSQLTFRAARRSEATTMHQRLDENLGRAGFEPAKA
jgi:hypothetical protein